MEIVLFQQNDETISDERYVDQIQKALKTPNVTFLTWDSNWSTIITSGLRVNLDYEPLLLITDPNAPIIEKVSAFIRGVNANLLNVIRGMKEVALSSSNRTFAILTSSFDPDPAITPSVLELSSSKKVTIVRTAGEPSLLVVPPNLAAWFYDAFIDEQTILFDQSFALLADRPKFREYNLKYSIENGDSTFLILAEKYKDRIQIFNFDGTREAGLKLLARFLISKPPKKETYLFHFLYSLLMFIFLFIFFLPNPNPFRLP